MMNSTPKLPRLLTILLLTLILTITSTPYETEAATKYTVTLMSYSGNRVLKTYKVTPGKTIVLPASKNTTNTVFMGWSTRPYKKKAPTYLPAQKIKVKKNMTLYETRFKRASDTMPAESSFPAVNTAKYSEAFIVGDSRVSHMRSAIIRNYSKDFMSQKHIDFVCLANTRLADFLNNTTGDGTYALLKQKLAKTDQNTRKVVIFCFGVNDLEKGCDVNATKLTYVHFLRRFKKELDQEYNCDLYFMSVNPVNQKTTVRHEEDIRTFNKYVKSSGTFGAFDGYIDTYTWLYKNGFNFWHIFHNVDDGVHFSPATSLRTLQYAIRCINA